MGKAEFWYAAVVREKGTLRELARYSYPTHKEAADVVRDLRQGRIKERRENVTVTLEKERS